MINFEIIENIQFTKIATMRASNVPPLNTHLILQGIDYIIIDYVIVDTDVNVWKIVVRMTTSNDKQYTAKNI